MAIADILVLGPITFTNFSTPEQINFGGRQFMKTHVLLGGRRVIDTLGPDDADIQWQGKFFGDGAYDTAQALDSLRASGNVLPLSYAGMGFAVVIVHFHANIRRMPLWVEYDIGCIIASNGAQGILGAVVAGVDALVGADLTTAIGLA